MSKENTRSEQVEKSDSEPYRVRLPGFLAEEEVGLGDVIKHVTHTFRIRPCRDCEGRAAALNRWFVFSGWPK